MKTYKNNSDWRQGMRTYDRTWEEIETMLEDAIKRKEQWGHFYVQSKKDDDKESMKDAARNSKALEGVVKTLKWVLGEEGIRDPLN